jgi:hypothetical protein
MSVTLLDDAEIADLNASFLGHAGVTDVISFALYDGAEMPVGDIYMWVRSQAQRQAYEPRGRYPEETRAPGGPRHTARARTRPPGGGEERVESAMWRLQERIVQGGS